MVVNDNRISVKKKYMSARCRQAERGTPGGYLSEPFCGCQQIRKQGGVSLLNGNFLFEQGRGVL